MSPPAKPGHPLTRRELQVLRLAANGHTDTAISRALFIAESTVMFHMRRICTKLEASNRAHAAALALAGGILKPADIGRTSGAEETCEATHGAVQRLAVVWRHKAPPRVPALAAAWWQQRLDELAHAIRKDTTP